MKSDSFYLHASDKLNIHQYQHLSMAARTLYHCETGTNQSSTRYQEHSNKINTDYITNAGFALYLDL